MSLDAPEFILKLSSLDSADKEPNKIYSDIHFPAYEKNENFGGVLASQ